MKPLIYALCFLIINVKTLGQNNQIDSLNRLLNTEKNDYKRIYLYLQLSDKCEVTDNLKYAEPAIRLTDKLLNTTKDKQKRNDLLKQKVKLLGFCSYYYDQVNDTVNKKSFLFKELELYKQLNDTNGTFDKYLNISSFYFDNGYTQNAINYYEKAIDFAKEKKNPRLIAYGHFQMGVMFLQNSDYSGAKDYFEKANKTYTELKDTAKLSWGIKQVGVCYSGMQDTVNALKYFKQAIKLNENDKDQRGIIRIYMDIADAYKISRNFANAILFYKRAISLSQKINFPPVYYLATNRLGNTYRDAGNYDSALVYINKSYQISLQENNPDGIFWSEYSLAKTFFALKNYTQAKFYFDKVYKTAQMKIDRFYSANIELTAYKLDSIFGNYKSSLEHYIKYIGMRDKFNSEDLIKQATKEKYTEQIEKQKLEQEIKDTEAEANKKRQQYIIYSIVSVLIIVFVFSLLLYRRFRITNKQKAIIAEQKHLVEEKHREITDSFNYAERIQKSFLATKEMLDSHLKDYFILFKPKDVVSGDFYWAETLTNGNFVLVTADSTGHGVPGAIMSLLNITSLERAIEQHTDPAEILNETRKIIIQRLKRDGSADGGKDGMDCSLIVFDNKNMKLYVAAAHNPVWIVRSSSPSRTSGSDSPVNEALEVTVIEIKPDKMPVGKHDRDKESFTTHSIDLKQGDVIYTLTDGFPDQFGGEKGKKFMSKNLRELLAGNANLSMIQQRELLENTFTKWIGNLEQIDDVTVLGIRI